MVDGDSANRRKIYSNVTRNAELLPTILFYDNGAFTVVS
jgi:hypothetical protein